MEDNMKSKALPKSFSRDQLYGFSLFCEISKTEYILKKMKLDVQMCVDQDEMNIRLQNNV